MDLLIACRSDYSPAGVGITCQKRRCECCLYVKTQSEFGNARTGKEFTITGPLACNSKNIIYLLECKKCDEQYVGETKRTLRSRLYNHLSDIRTYRNTSVAEHFNQLDHDITDLEITPVVQIPDMGSDIKNGIARRKQELFFIKKLGSMNPDGMNDKLVDHGKIARCLYEQVYKRSL